VRGAGYGKKSNSNGAELPTIYFQYFGLEINRLNKQGDQSSDHLGMIHNQSKEKPHGNVN